MAKLPSFQVFRQGTAAYPHKLTVYLGDVAPIQACIMGKLPLGNSSLALLCSSKAPASILLAVHDLAQQWRHDGAPIISGFHSPVEQEAFTILLREPGRPILCPARHLPQRIKPEWQAPLTDGRLTILSPFAETVKRATKETAAYRNRFAAALAEAVLIAYAHPGGDTERLAQEVVGWGKAIYTLPHESTASLRAMGVRVLEEL